jgi:hypothetical protein
MSENNRHVRYLEGVEALPAEVKIVIVYTDNMF